MIESSLLRRLGAITYDLLLVIALLFLATTPFVIAAGDAIQPYTAAHQMTLFLVIYAFFVGFWTRTGSTLGMLAWNLRVLDDSNRPPSLMQATVRFFAAMVSWLPAGLGFLWQLWDKERLTWHDRASNTRLMHAPRPKSE
ncbi:MAG: RDD family protein [Pseudomonadota bacterium]